LITKSTPQEGNKFGKEPAKEGGYVAYAPSLPGCNTQGDTLEEAEKNITEAVGL